MASRSLLFHCVILMITPLPPAPCGAQESESQNTYILATGRRLPYLYAISLDDAIEPANHNTSNAIVSRSKVALDRLDGRLLGDPANLIVSEDGGTV
jgi:hypothetical protein